jgi:hypothetical protein
VKESRNVILVSPRHYIPSADPLYCPL